MVNNRDSGRPRPHLRYVGIQPATAIRYRTVLRHFFAFLDSHHIPAPRTLEDLDDIGAENINKLYQDDRPLAWAGDFMCGIKRFYPRCRRAMGTTNLFYKNWAKSIKRSRALPLSGEIVMAISSFALLENDVEFSAAALVSFVGLLRSGEICGLTGKNVQFHGNFTLASISLPSSKRRREKGRAGARVHPRQGGDKASRGGPPEKRPFGAIAARRGQALESHFEEVRKVLRHFRW